MRLLRQLFQAGIGAGPMFFIAWMMFCVWRDPMSVQDGTWVRFGVGLMVIEFLLVHSSVFMGVFVSSQKTWRRRAKFFFALLGFYGLMGVGMAAAMQSRALLAMLGGVMLSRFIVLVVEADQSATAHMVLRSVLSVVLYLAGAFATIFVPIPEAGITRGVLEQVYSDRGSGLWEQEPHRAIVFAMGYFAMMGLYELWAAFQSPVSMSVDAFTSPR